MGNFLHKVILKPNEAIHPELSWALLNLYMGSNIHFQWEKVISYTGDSEAKFGLLFTKSSAYVNIGPEHRVKHTHSYQKLVNSVARCVNSVARCFCSLMWYDLHKIVNIC